MELQTQFEAVGFIPRNAMNSMRERHQQAVQKFVAGISGISEEEKVRLALQTELNDLKNDPFADKKASTKRAEHSKEDW